jgi:hypothetical protein
LLLRIIRKGSKDTEIIHLGELMVNGTMRDRKAKTADREEAQKGEMTP